MSDGGTPTDRLVNYVLREWRVILQAKALFGAAAILLVGITTIAVWWFRGSLDDSEVKGLGATIKANEATIKTLDERAQYAEQRLIVLQGNNHGSDVGPSKLTLTWDDPLIPHDNIVGVNVNWLNEGTRAAVDPQIAWDGDIFEHDPTDKDIAELFDKITKHFLVRGDSFNATKEIQPGKSEYIGIDFPPIKYIDLIRSVKNGQKFFVFGFAVRYKDDGLLGNQSMEGF